MRAITYSFMLILIILSCKESIKTDINAQKATENTNNEQHTPTPKPAINVPALYNQAEAILKFREENSPKKWAIIDVGAWKYDGIFKSGELLKPEEVEGKWIDFDQKGKYDYGLKSSIQGHGRYHYDNEKSTLLLLDDDKTKKPEEYNVRLVNGIMIVQGMDTYNDNNFQAKLSKVEARPK